MGVSYRGRTYEEGKKIGAKDGLRALYCIFRYNAHNAPVPVQFLFYIRIGGIAAIVNLVGFLVLMRVGARVSVAAPAAFLIAAVANYVLCIVLLFRHRARWSTSGELVAYWAVVSLVCLIDLGATKVFLASGLGSGTSKLLASIISLLFNFMGRRFFVFPEPSRGPWKPQEKASVYPDGEEA